MGAMMDDCRYIHVREVFYMDEAYAANPPHLYHLLYLYPTIPLLEFPSLWRSLHSRYGIISPYRRLINGAGSSCFFCCDSRLELANMRIATGFLAPKRITPSNPSARHLVFGIIAQANECSRNQSAYLDMTRRRRNVDALVHAAVFHTILDRHLCLTWHDVDTEFGISVLVLS